MTTCRKYIYTQIITQRKRTNSISMYFNVRDIALNLSALWEKWIHGQTNWAKSSLFTHWTIQSDQRNNRNPHVRFHPKIRFIRHWSLWYSILLFVWLLCERQPHTSSMRMISMISIFMAWSNNCKIHCIKQWIWSPSVTFQATCICKWKFSPMGFDSTDKK